MKQLSLLVNMAFALGLGSCNYAKPNQIELNIPKDEKPVVEKESPGLLRVNISGGDSISIRNGNERAEKWIDMATLDKVISEQYATYGDTFFCAITTNIRAKYGQVIDIMDLLKKKGVKKFALVDK